MSYLSRERKEILRKKIIVIFVIVFMISTALSCFGLEENNEQKNTVPNAKMFSVVFGAIIADGIIYHIAPFYGLYEFYCAPVTKLTFIGIGGYNFEHHFYMKTFTNVTQIIGHTIRNLHVSEESQHFITVHSEITNICNFYTT